MKQLATAQTAGAQSEGHAKLRIKDRPEARAARVEAAAARVEGAYAVPAPDFCLPSRGGK